MANLQTLAESFLADLDELSDEDEPQQEDMEEQADDDDDKASHCTVSMHAPLHGHAAPASACWRALGNWLVRAMHPCRWMTSRR